MINMCGKIWRKLVNGHESSAERQFIIFELFYEKPFFSNLFYLLVITKWNFLTFTKNRIFMTFLLSGPKFILKTVLKSYSSPHIVQYHE